MFHGDKYISVLYSSVCLALQIFFMYPAYIVHIPNAHASKKHYNPFSWSDERKPVLKPQGPQSHDPKFLDQFICH